MSPETSAIPDEAHDPCTMTGRPLPASFFSRNTIEVARDLLGALLVKEEQGMRLTGRIVETEAYTADDPACHAWGISETLPEAVRRTRRGYRLFGSPGTAYVYLNYGMYWLLNVVTEPEGRCGAVLIRAVEPLEGIETMRANRPHVMKDVELTNGPGKLTLAFGIDGSLHDCPLTGPPVYFAEGSGESFEIASTSRIGIRRGVDLPWRFFVAGNAFISPGRPSGPMSGEF